MWQFPYEIKGFDSNEVLIYEAAFDPNKELFNVWLYHTGTHKYRQLNLPKPAISQNILAVYPI